MLTITINWLILFNHVGQYYEMIETPVSKNGHKDRMQKNCLIKMFGFDLLQLTIVLAFMGILMSAILVAVPHIKERMAITREIDDLMFISKNIKQAYAAGQDFSGLDEGTLIKRLVELDIFPSTWMSKKEGGDYIVKDRFGKEVESKFVNDLNLGKSFLHIRFKNASAFSCRRIVQALESHYDFFKIGKNYNYKTYADKEEYLEQGCYQDNKLSQNNEYWIWPMLP